MVHAFSTTMIILLCRRMSQVPQFRRLLLRSCPITGAEYFQVGYLVRHLSPFRVLCAPQLVIIHHCLLADTWIS